MVPAGNQAKYNSLVNHTTKKIHHHHHHQYFISSKFVGCESFPELTLLIILLYMKQTWKSQLIDFNHFSGKDYFHLFESFYYSYLWPWNWCEWESSVCLWPKLLRFIFFFLIGFTLLIVLLCFTHCPLLYVQFLCNFIYSR